MNRTRLIDQEEEATPVREPARLIIATVAPQVVVARVVANGAIDLASDTAPHTRVDIDQPEVRGTIVTNDGVVVATHGEGGTVGGPGEIAAAHLFEAEEESWCSRRWKGHVEQVDRALA